MSLRSLRQEITVGHPLWHRNCSKRAISFVLHHPSAKCFVHPAANLIVDKKHDLNYHLVICIYYLCISSEVGNAN